MDEFERFWREYPRRVAKGAARKAFTKAIRRTDLETMLQAIQTYKKHKPDYCDFCHPATWLNNERWEDEYETESQPRGYETWSDDDKVMAARIVKSVQHVRQTQYLNADLKRLVEDGYLDAEEATRKGVTGLKVDMAQREFKRGRA